MNPEHVKVLVTKRMPQATETLEDGRGLLAAGRGERTAVNRRTMRHSMPCWRYCKP